MICRANVDVEEQEAQLAENSRGKTIGLRRLLMQVLSNSQKGATSTGVKVVFEHVPNISIMVLNSPRIPSILNCFVGNALRHSAGPSLAVSVKIIETPQRQAEIEFSIRLECSLEKSAVIREEFIAHATYQDVGSVVLAEQCLGLSTCAKAIRQLAGQLGHRAEGNTQVIWFKLPLLAVLPSNYLTNLGGENAVIAVAKDQIRALTFSNHCEVLTAMMARYGFDLVSLSDPRLIIELLQFIEFDLIVVDLTMPQDALVPLIKRLRQENHKRWLIAIDDSKCALPSIEGIQIAGFLRRPFEEVEAEALLQSIVGEFLGNILTARAQISTRELRSEILDYGVLGEMRSVLGDEEFRRQCETFATELLNSLQRIDHALSTQSVSDCAVSAHNLGGAAGMFGALGFRDILLSLESLTREKDFDSANALWPQVKIGAFSVRNELRSVLVGSRADQRLLAS